MGSGLEVDRSGDSRSVLSDQRSSMDSTGSSIRSASLNLPFVLLHTDIRRSTGPLKGYTLVAHRSGHTLGGSLYTLRPSLSSSLSPASSASSLLYAPLFNHIKEHHLDPTSLLSGGNVDDNMRRMGVMVVGAQRSRAVNIKRIDRERKLLGMFCFLSSNE